VAALVFQFGLKLVTAFEKTNKSAKNDPINNPIYIINFFIALSSVYPGKKSPLPR
jgi:hypothetical protein